jgi:hypothetical protein
MCYTVQHTAT